MANASGWEILESGPADAQRTALLLPGGMCTAGFYEELMAEPALEGVHLVAATLPGHGGTVPPEDLRVENYARLTSELADVVGADVVVGHSMGADEAIFLRALDRLGRVLAPCRSSECSRSSAWR